MKGRCLRFARGMSIISALGLTLSLGGLGFGSWTLWDWHSKCEAAEKAKLARHQSSMMERYNLSSEGEMLAKSVRSFADRVIAEGRLAEKMLSTWLAISSILLGAGAILMVVGRRGGRNAGGKGSDEEVTPAEPGKRHSQ